MVEDEVAIHVCLFAVKCFKNHGIKLEPWRTFVFKYMLVIQLCYENKESWSFVISVPSRYIHSHLTHIGPAFLFWDIGKQCRSRSDAAEHGV